MIHRRLYRDDTQVKGSAKNRRERGEETRLLLFPDFGIVSCNTYRFAGAGLGGTGAVGFVGAGVAACAAAAACAAGSNWAI